MIATFTGPITKEEKSGWMCVVWPESVALLGTGKPTRVLASADGHEFEVTLMPMGGKHMVPLKLAVRELLKKGMGDQVEMCIKQKVEKA